MTSAAVEREDREARAAVPVLQPSRERHLAELELRAAGLEMAMEAIGTEAFLVSGDGRVLAANRPARLAWANDEPGMRTVFAHVLAGGADRGTWSIGRVVAADGRICELVVRRRDEPDRAARLLVAAARWQLTRRQAEVLEHLVRGLPNKAIAAALRCSAGTVELHVSAIFQKAGAASRGDLAARFWSAF